MKGAHLGLSNVGVRARDKQRTHPAITGRSSALTLPYPAHEMRVLKWHGLGEGHLDTRTEPNKLCC